MRTLTFAVIAVGCATNASPGPQPARTIVLKESAAAVALKPCTRIAPKAAAGIWAPSATAVQRLTDRVGRALVTQAADDHGSRPLALDQYVLGVAGFIRGGRQWLYGSFVALDGAQDATSGEWPNWCDGSWRYFGVEYDVAADTLGPFRPNAGEYAQ